MSSLSVEGLPARDIRDGQRGGRVSWASASRTVGGGVLLRSPVVSGRAVAVRTGLAAGVPFSGGKFGKVLQVARNGREIVHERPRGMMTPIQGACE
jgi:hypothetical protein